MSRRGRTRSSISFPRLFLQCSLTHKVYPSVWAKKLSKGLPEETKQPDHLLKNANAPHQETFETADGRLEGFWLVTSQLYIEDVLSWAPLHTWALPCIQLPNPASTNTPCHLILTLSWTSPKTALHIMRDSQQ
jgi:hypothetical protein